MILGDKVKTIWGEDYITDKIGDISYEISPLSFFQVNPKQTWKLVFQSIGICRSSRRRDSLGSVLWNWDDFSVPCAEGKVCPWCGDCSGSNWRRKKKCKSQRIGNVEFFVGNGREVLPAEYEKMVLLQTWSWWTRHRKGCDEMLLKTILKMQPKRVVYVSCDSATLARDLRFLCDNGYELKKVCGVDQFPQTVHVETVCLLSKKCPV